MDPCRFIRRFLSLAVVSGFLAAFPAAASPALGGTNPSNEVVLQLAWKHQFQFAGYYAALHKGFYEEAGLDVRIAEGGEGRFAREEVLSGRAQYGVAGTELILQRAEGDPFVVLAPIFQHSPSILLARKNSGISSFQDLIGRRVMLLPGKKDADILAAFLNEGVSLDAIQRLDQTYDLNDLIEGRTDAVSAYVTNEPWHLRKNGVEPVVLSPLTYGVDFYSDCLFTTEEEIDRHPDRVSRFLAASLRGWEYAMDHPEEIIDRLLTDYSVTKSRDHLRYEAAAIREIMMPDLVEIGHLNPGRWRHIARTYAKLGMLEPGCPLEGFLYDPHPGADYAWPRWLLGAAIAGGLLVSIGSAVLFVFNRKLAAEIRERKRAEEELRAGEEKLRNIVENSSNLFYSHTADHRLTYLSPQCREFLQCEPEEAMTRWTEFATDNPINEIGFASTARAIRTGRPQPPYELELIGKKGRKIFVEVRESPVVENGQTVAVVGALTDITDRRAAEEELRDLYETMDLAQKMAGIGYWSYDKKTGQRRWSDQMFTIIGVDPEKGPPAEDDLRPHFHPEDWPVYADAFAGALAGTPYSLVLRVVWRGGEIRFLDTQGFPRTDSAGRVIGCFGTSQDITDRKRAEDALKESEEKYRRIFENSVVGLFQSSPDGFFLQVNPAFASMLGYDSPGDIVSSVTDIATQYYADPEDRRRYQEILRKEGRVENFEFQVRRKDGSKLWVSNNTRANFDADGRIIRYEGIVVDITDRKRAETEGEKLQYQLLQAQKMESVGRLAGGIAHDFNNVLGVILGYTDIILSDLPADNPHKTDLLQIRLAAQRSADLTRQLLAFARRQTIAPRVLDLNDTIEKTLNMLRRLIGEDIDLVWKPETNLWPVKMDPAQIDQILANLCVNARDAISRTGEITIETRNTAVEGAEAEAQADVSAGQYVVLTVRDSGRGMDEETLSHLFEPFFTTKRFGKGTGLGLSTVYGIVRQNEGFIQVHSAPGKGAAFRIYLPRHTGSTDESRAETSETPSSGAGETILVVEDEISILKLAEKMLQGLGYRVLTASTPTAGLDVGKGHTGSIDLLMTDVVMPEMNGRELAEKLTAFHPNLKTLFMSGYTADVIARHGVLEEGVHFIQKPFSKKELAVKIREVIGGP